MDPYRFLGFAFASADLLVEVDPQSRITFAVGATQGLRTDNETQLVGKSWRELIAPNDHELVESLFASLREGRRGPITVELRPRADGERRFGQLSACRLHPQANYSCAVSLGAPSPLHVRTIVDEDGYQDRSGFESLAKTVLNAAAAIGQELDLALVEMPGLSSALEELGASRGSAVLRRFASALRAEAYGGASPTRLDDERFAVIRPKGGSPEQLQGRLNTALALNSDAEGLASNAHVLAIEPGAGSLDRSLRALRYAIESFATGGATGFVSASLNDAFNRSVQQTLAEAGEFGAAVRARRFNLVFQPVVSLKTGLAEHFETLVRFQEDTSPYKLIRMAEELDLILELDLAIAEQALDRLVADQRKSLSLAVNVSGRSIMDPWFISEVRRLGDSRGDAARRLIFEVTESVTMENLAVANRHIQELRSDGHLVCLDDFGAGASSYAYLQKLHVDVIKIDGRYVKELAEDGRDSTLVRHLVNLSRELGVTTIAEMISSQEVEDAARAAGVDFGQGYHYGQPTSEPSFTPKSRPLVTNARRKGVVETWG